MTLVHITAVALIALPTALYAQEFPNMLGTWTGSAEGIVIGDPLHFSPEGDGPGTPRRAGFDLTIEISHQDGRFIWGTVSGGGATEPWLATIWNDGQGYMGVDSDGHMFGRILSENEVENCYAHTTETMVASCVVMTRE